MFTHDCFIKANTPELREYLKDLGYKVLNFKNAPYLVRDDGYDGQEEFQDSYDIKSYSGEIDCGENIELFKAIAALRSDSDYMQWFIYDDSSWNDHPCVFWYRCKCNTIKEDMGYNLMCNDCTKATIEELVEHFTISNKMIELKRTDGSIIFEYETEDNSVKKTLEAYIKKEREKGKAIVDLTYVDLQGANLEGIDLSWTNLRDVDLTFADLHNANLEGAKLIGTDLSFSDLSNSNLFGVYLTSVELRATKLKESYLRQSFLTYTNLNNADLSNAVIEDAELKYSDLINANLSNATLRWAVLHNVNLKGADLTNADLRGTNLRYTNLHSANLNNTDLTDAILYETN